MNTRFIITILLSAGAIAALGCAAAEPRIEYDYGPRIDPLMPGMGAAEIPARKDAQLELERLCHEMAAPGQEAHRASLAKAMIDRAGPETAQPARVWILRKLDTIGGPEVVTGLAAIMKESDPEIRDPARRALANNPSPKAAAALRDALAESKDAEEQVALINALGWRHDADSVRAISKLAKSENAAVARAASAALGDIADSASVKALAGLRKSAPANVRPTAVDASLRAADSLRLAGKASQAARIYEELLAGSEPEDIRIAALTGLAEAKERDAVPTLVKFVNGDDGHMRLIAAQCLQRMDKRATRAIVSAMTSATGDAKALLLEVLGEHGEAAALKAVAGEATSESTPVRLAALGAIGKLGDGTMVPLLIERGTKSEGAERDAARDAMASLHGKDVDGLILERLATSEGSERVELLYAVWGRRIAAAKPIVMDTARSGAPPVREAALTALERLAKTEDLEALIGLLINANSDTTRKLAAEAIASVCRRSGDDRHCSTVLASAVEPAPATGKVALIRLLAQIQDEAGLPVIRASAKSGEAEVMRAAADALKQWRPTRITTWVFSGPYAQDGKGPQDLFDVAFPPEQPDASAEWKPVKVNARGNQNAPIDLQKLAKAQNCCGYCRVTISSDRQQDVVFTFGSDDGLKVWLNGDVVHSKNAVRGMNCDEDTCKATLNEGENTLLVKVTQGGGDWSFCCRIASAEGGPPDGVSFDAK